MLNTGLRVGELMAITWGDIDLKNNLITVNKSSETLQDKSEFATKKKKEVIGTPKTKKSNRFVVINKAAKDVLKKIKKVNRGHTGKNDRVILSTKFTVPSRRNISRCLEEITVNACTSFQTSGVHRLCHTYATNFLNRGVSLSFISNQLGHAKESTTRDIYVSYLAGQFNEDKKQFEKF